MMRKAPVLALAAGIAGLLVASPAMAGPGDDPVADAPTAADTAAASRVATAANTLSTLGRFFVRANAADGVATQDEAARGARLAPRVVGQPVAVYHLNGDFVRSAGAPVARRQFMASTVTTSDGRSASVWTAPDQAGRWAVVNIALGNDEAEYAARAGNGVAFVEPQINAWYTLRGDRVVPLNDDARKTVGAHGVSVTAYHRLVHQRYADKLPGSAYDKSGRAGGYDPGGSPAGDAPRGAALPLSLAGGAAVLLLGLRYLGRRRGLSLGGRW